MYLTVVVLRFITRIQIQYVRLNHDDVDRIVKQYKQTCNQDLIGDGLGNFHVDFSMDGAATEIYGVDFS